MNEPNDDFVASVQALRPQLLRFARSQLRNEAWAEDAVSETLLAALEKPEAFDGRSQLQTSLVGVLTHKLIAQLRHHPREATMRTAEDAEDLDELLFDATNTDHWREPPQDWGSPDAVLDQRQFFDVLQACVDHLPPAQARVFMMREWLDLSTDEICKELQITSTNLWVMLHRARLRLRNCLQQRWFDKFAVGTQPGRPR